MADAGNYVLPTVDNVEIRDVWGRNWKKELKIICENIGDFPYIAIDTEFPGCPRDARSIDNTYYDTMRQNVSDTKLIQLGITLFNDKGELPTCGTKKSVIWQINFKDFNPNCVKEIMVPESVQLLAESGIDFKIFHKEGVDTERFINSFSRSRLTMNKNVRWITFQGSYDFCYLLKHFWWFNKPPENEKEFMANMKIQFPKIFDIKHVMQYCGMSPNIGLEVLAKKLGVKRVGSAHQAGSDSLMTSCIFQTLKGMYGEDHFDKYSGVLHGITLRY